MNGIEFSYIVSTDEQSEAFQAMRKKHCQEVSPYNDNDYLTQIFGYLSETYRNLTVDCRNSLKQKKEEDITDVIRLKLKKNESFGLSGFLVDTEARNDSTNMKGYYDLKFQHSDWINKYLVLECKPIDATKSKRDSYFHKTIKRKGVEYEDGGLYRFVINKYATDKSFGGMLGYIISNNPAEVVAKLKKETLSFQRSKGKVCFGNLLDKELLEKPIPNLNYSYQSNHIRVCGEKLISPIHIFHIFFDLT